MAMLQNNTQALAMVGGMDKAALEAIFGPQSPVSGKIVGALPNTDTDGMKQIFLTVNPAGLVAGLKALVVLTGAKGAELSVSCPVHEQEFQASAGTAHLSLTITQEKLVNKGAHRKQGDLLVTLDTLAAMAERLVGNTPGVVVCVDENVPVEVSADTTLASLLPDTAKAVLADHTFYTLQAAQALTAGELVSGQIDTLDESRCLVQETLAQLHAQRSKSCGKCTFCREGLYQLTQIVEEVTQGRAKPADLALAQEIGQAMNLSCNCTLGDHAAAPVLSLLERFAPEVERHTKDKVCPAGSCLALTQIYIDPKLCQGSGACADVCPVHCIETKPGHVSVIDTFDCTRCGQCLSVCAQGAIQKVSGKLPKGLPTRPVPLKGHAVAQADAAAPAAPRRRVRSRLTVTNPKSNSNPVPVAEKVQVNVVKTLETDVVIIAGGPAGLAAAITAGEQGLKSIILEKSSATGGAANMGMGPLGIDTRIQKEQFNEISVKDALDKHMQYTHYQVDSDLVQTYFNKSADTIAWLEEMGVEFAGAFRYFKESEATWHIVKPENGVIGPRAASAMVKVMTQRAKELGCEILLETPATSLIQEDSKVCGAIAVDKDGNGIAVRGKAVIVATGGFGNNAQMIEEEFGLHLGQDFFPFQIPGITGDGLRMMWEVGAAKFGANIEAIYQIPDNLSWFLLDAVLRQPNLLINQWGDRFMNEGDMGNTTYVGNALRLQPGNYGYCIMDEGILKEYKRRGPDIMDIVHPADAFLAFDGQAAKAVEAGYEGYIEADTLEELAEKLHIDVEKLRDTIDEYNQMCAQGVDTKFHKPQKYLHPITGRGKYLVGKYYVAAYGTVGGVRINKYCEVLDADLNPIEGLYSAGSDANTIYGDSYNFTLPGNTMGFAVNSGRMAGESVAEYIADCQE